MTWETSDRRDRLPDDWQALRAKVLKRDGNRCTFKLPSFKRCPRPATDVDHVRPGDDHRLSNLRSLCEHHHGKKSSQEGRRAKADRRASRYRTPEAHPGRVR